MWKVAWTSRVVLASGLVFPFSSVRAELPGPDDLRDIAENAPGVIEHCDEDIAERDFLKIFDCGDEMFESTFTAVDGVGANIGRGQRFTRTPRFDLDEYARIRPKRTDGPDGTGCTECHQGAQIGGGGDGPGNAASNIISDLAGIRGVADPKNFINRNPPHLFAPGAIQLAAEEMTRDLIGIRDAAVQAACSQMQPVSMPLSSKGVSFGMITVLPAGCPDPMIDISGIEGVDADLVVKPFGWKGIVPSLRVFNAVAFHNAIGMTPTELIGPGVDGDFDGVTDEITIEDVSAMTVYLAAQPRPTSLLELDDLFDQLSSIGPAGTDAIQRLGIPSLSDADRAQINRGADVFADIGCADCHQPSLPLTRTTFAEPSPNPEFRVDFGIDPRFPQVVDAANPLTFDITRDQPNNVIEAGVTLRFGRITIRLGNRVMRRLGSLESGPNGGAIARSFTDLKRHDMGPELAESLAQPEPLNPAVSIPPSVFLTEPLWGVGSSSPYLHDGRATTIEEAILEHGGESAASRANFRALAMQDRADVLAFLNNLVLFFPDGQPAASPENR